MVMDSDLFTYSDLLLITKGMAWLWIYSFMQTRKKRMVALVLKNLPASVGDIRDGCSIPWLERSSGEGHGNPIKYSCLENPMDRGAWWATVHEVAESDMTERLSSSGARGVRGPRGQTPELAIDCFSPSSLRFPLNHFFFLTLFPHQVILKQLIITCSIAWSTALPMPTPIS